MQRRLQARHRTCQAAQLTPTPSKYGCPRGHPRGSRGTTRGGSGYNNCCTRPCTYFRDTRPLIDSWFCEPGLSYDRECTQTARGDSTRPPSPKKTWRGHLTNPITSSCSQENLWRPKEIQCRRFADHCGKPSVQHDVATISSRRYQQRKCNLRPKCSIPLCTLFTFPFNMYSAFITGSSADTRGHQFFVMPGNALNEEARKVRAE